MKYIDPIRSILALIIGVCLAVAGLYGWIDKDFGEELYYPPPATLTIGLLIAGMKVSTRLIKKVLNSLDDE